MTRSHADRSFARLRPLLALLLALSLVALAAPSGLAQTKDLTKPAEPAPKQPQDEPRASDSDDKPESGMRKFWNRFRRPSIYQRSHDSVKEPFAAVTRKPSRSTVRVLVKGDQVSLGVVVGEGLLLTKASELRGGEELACQFYDGRRLTAEQVGASDDLDLALLKVNGKNLSVVEWNATEVPVGGWLVTPGLDDMPVSIGVVSTRPRTIPKSRALLGVRLGPNPKDPKGGARVGMVFPNSGAEKAGVEVADLIVGADDVDIATPEDLIAHVSGMLPGDRVRLKIRRGNEEKTITAELKDQEALSQSRVETQNSLGGPISRRRSGFSRVIQHDSVLRPEQCGGPLVNLDGQVVGMNIARAGRVASYALPASEVLRVLPQLMETMDNYKLHELAQQLSELEADARRVEQLVQTYRDRLTRAEAQLKEAADAQPADVAAAKKSVEDVKQLVKEASERLTKINSQVSELRDKQRFVTREESNGE